MSGGEAKQEEELPTPAVSSGYPIDYDYPLLRSPVVGDWHAEPGWQDTIYLRIARSDRTQVDTSQNLDETR